MGSFSIWHWIIVLLIVLLLFGAGKLPSVMGDIAKGVKAFKSGLKDEEDETAQAAPPPVAAQPPPASPHVAPHVAAQAPAASLDPAHVRPASAAPTAAPAADPTKPHQG